ncbi:MAG TPA: hypothetical protein DCS82_05300 [Rhodospirillaceae bacterium]|nr:hypothetical protein [Rhodospirillaceae bacterium]HAA92706.1 hypothetical protein [Rhodospirillaceae bacterium]HAT35110.1 hypothetical protein [Rhodospirillaceae bacterium]
MSLFGGIRAAVSGLFSQSQSLGMIGDNIANVNTVGFKAVRPRFSTLVTASGSETLHSPGGVQSNVLREIDQQGLLEAADSSTDIAISGDGFFPVNSNATATGEFLFTRAGSFRADEDGNLVNAAGFFLLGFQVTNQIPQQTNVLSQLQVVNIANQSAAPSATSTVDIGANLQASAATGATFDLSVPLLDQQGTSHTFTLTFTKAATPANTWDLTGTLTGADFVATGGTIAAGANVSGATAAPLATITFDAAGLLSSVALPAAPTTNATPTGSADGFTFTVDYDQDAGPTFPDRVDVTIDFGTVGSATGLTQFEGAFTPNFITQNGRQFGSITGVSVGDDGIVTAVFDNGESRTISQVPVVTFTNPNGLTEKSGNVFEETVNSGTATIKIANTGGAGIIAASSLEASTVDLADEFTRMIITQRAFSANTRVITTGDEMLDELVRIVR